jgi:beta-glucosidase
MTIDPLASNHPLGTWNVATQRWETSPGQYTLRVGNSSDALNLQHAITIGQ